jgi:hypothetical protein
VETLLARTVEAVDGAGTEERTKLESFTICSKACMLRPSLTGWLKVPSLVLAN